MRQKKYLVAYSNDQEYENQIFCDRIRKFYDQGYVLYKSIGLRRRILVFKNTEQIRKQCLVMQKNVSERVDQRTAQLMEEKQNILYQDRKIVVFETDRDKNYDIDAFEKEQNRAFGLPLSYKKRIIPMLLLLADIFLMVFRIKFYKPGHLLLDYYGKILPGILFFAAFLYLSGDFWDMKKGFSGCDPNKLYFAKRSAFKQAAFLAGDCICALLLLSYLVMSLVSFAAADAAVILEIVRSWMIFLSGYVFSFQWRTPYCSILMVMFVCLALI